MSRWILLLTAIVTSTARAEFGEIDLLVRESVERFFRDAERDVDLKTLSYFSQPEVKQNRIFIRSSVYGLDGRKRGWVWHDCWTTLERSEQASPWRDLGTECEEDWD